MPDWAALLDAAVGEVPDLAADAIGPYLDSAGMLGRRTAELHEVLSLGDTDQFEPEPFTTLYQRSLYQSMRTQVRPTLSLVRRMLPALEEHDPEGTADAEYVLDHEADLLAAFDAVRHHRIDASRIRVHGDYHLGQVLHAGRDFVIIDFEGEPSRSPTERRIKRGALTDVAGIVRRSSTRPRPGCATSRRAASCRPTSSRPSRRGAGCGRPGSTVGLPRRPTWPRPTATRSCPTIRPTPTRCSRAYVLDKALYEVRYDLAHRPDWAPIPLRGVASMLQSLET